MKRHWIAKAVALLPAIALLCGLSGNAASADERRERQERPGQREQHGHRDARDFYRSPHMVYDNRYRHGRYYPAPGYSVSVLPPGHIGINYGRGRYFFHGGVWYRSGPSGFFVVRPPAGIVVPVLPLGYSTLWLGSVPYYYANDVYYTGGSGGYVVVEPPATVMIEQPPAADTPAPVASPSTPPQAPGSWYYCESAKAYYPYVGECKEGWRPVPATPPASK